jgi:hypothetical protein
VVYMSSESSQVSSQNSNEQTLVNSINDYVSDLKTKFESSNVVKWFFRDFLFFPSNTEYQQIYLIADAAHKIFSTENPKDARTNTVSFLRSLVKNDIEDALLYHYESFINSEKTKSKDIRNFNKLIEQLKNTNQLNFDPKKSQKLETLNKMLVAKEIKESIEYIREHPKSAWLSNRFFTAKNKYIEYLYPLLDLVTKLEKKINTTTREKVLDSYIQLTININGIISPLGKDLIVEFLGDAYNRFCSSSEVSYTDTNNIDIENFRYYAYRAAENLELDLKVLLPKAITRVFSHSNTENSLKNKKFTELKNHISEYKKPLKAIQKALDDIKKHLKKHLIKRSSEENLTDDDYALIIDRIKNFQYASKDELINPKNDISFTSIYNELIDLLVEDHITVQQTEAYRTAVFRFINYRASLLGRHTTGISENELLEQFKENDKILTEHKSLNLIKISANFLQNIQK